MGNSNVFCNADFTNVEIVALSRKVVPQSITECLRKSFRRCNTIIKIYILKNFAKKVHLTF